MPSPGSIVSATRPFLALTSEPTGMSSERESSTNSFEFSRLTRILPLTGRATTVSPACGVGVGVATGRGVATGSGVAAGCGAATVNARLTGGERLPAASTARSSNV